MQLITTLRRGSLRVPMWLDPADGSIVVEAWERDRMVDAAVADTVDQANSMSLHFAREYEDRIADRRDRSASAKCRQMGAAR